MDDRVDGSDYIVVFIDEITYSRETYSRRGIDRNSQPPNYLFDNET